MTEQTDSRALIEKYIQAFEARNVAACLECFSENATLDFQGTLYTGRADIENWHNERFAANLRILRMESVTLNGDTATVDVEISSDRLAAWKVKALKGRITIRLEDGRFKEGKLAARMTNLFDMLRGE